MKINDIRLANLKALVREFKTLTALAEAAKTNEKYLSQIINRRILKSGKPANVGDRLAEKLELAGRRPTGWMDTDHESGGVIVTNADMTTDEAELLRLYRQSNKDKKNALLVIARLKTAK